MAAFNSKWIVGLTLLLLLGGCGAEKPGEKERPRVRILEVQSSDFAPSVTLTGDVPVSYTHLTLPTILLV